MEVIDLTDEHMHFVCTCTHIDDQNEETDKIVRGKRSMDKGVHGKRIKG